MPGLEGTRLGDYELVELIGSGGMAEVYRARQRTAFGREVALKVIRPGYSEQEEFRSRFLREAQAISRLSHPNILPLIEFGEESQALYLVMPLIREGTLRDLIKQRNGPLALEEALPLFAQLCAAVHYAHTQGIIHRDIKPQNILLQHYTYVLLADFGIARNRREKTITATGAGIGSAEYMAPEQAIGHADTRSDIYSLGVVLYQMLTGVVPYSGSTPLQVLIKHTTAPLPDPRTLNPSIPAHIVQVLQTALAKDANQRFQSALALGRAAQQNQAGASWPHSTSALVGQTSNAPTPPAPASLHDLPTAPSAADSPARYEQRRSAPLNSPLGPYETRPANTYTPPPTASIPPSPPTLARTTPAASAPPSAAPLQPAPAYAPPAPPAAPTTPPPRKRKNRLITLLSAATLLALLGSLLLTLALTRTGPFASSDINQQTTPTPTAALPPGFNLYTHSDHSFRIIYPKDWQAKPATTVSGSGEQFTGPADQVVQVVNGGNGQPEDVGSSIDAFCVTFSFGPASPHTSITLAGQQWTREECDNPLGLHAIAEATLYKGHLYLISFASPSDSFNSNRAKYFTPMEQGFAFLS